MPTFNPNANPETTSVDGYSASWNANWTTARSATDGDAGNTSDSSTSLYVQVGKSSDPSYGIYRSFLLFDTSSLGAGATILSAKIRVYVTSKADTVNDGKDYVVVVSSSPASNTAITAADVDQVGSTALSDTQDITGVSTNAYLEFTLNASGIAAISKTGVTKLALREGHDMENVTYSGANSSYNYIVIDSAEGTNKPELVITTPSGGSLFFAQL